MFLVLIVPIRDGNHNFLNQQYHTKNVLIVPIRDGNFI